MLSSELHDATFRIVCEKNYGPLNLGTVIIAQKAMIISFYDIKHKYCIKMCVIRLYMMQKLILILFAFDVLFTHIDNYNGKVIECKSRENQ